MILNFVSGSASAIYLYVSVSIVTFICVNFLFHDFSFTFSRSAKIIIDSGTPQFSNSLKVERLRDKRRLMPSRVPQFYATNVPVVF